MIARGWTIIAREFVVALATSIIVTGLLLGLYEGKRNEDLYQNQIAACERGNVVRKKFAAAIEAQHVLNHEVARFLASSESFRLSQGEYALARQSRISRNKVIAQNEKLHPPKPLNCKAVIEEP